MKRDGLEFREALELLARKAGVELEARTPQAEAEDKQNERLREALAAATTYFHNLLRTSPQGQIARDHLAGARHHRRDRRQVSNSATAWTIGTRWKVTCAIAAIRARNSSRRGCSSSATTAPCSTAFAGG